MPVEYAKVSRDELHGLVDIIERTRPPGTTFTDTCEQWLEQHLGASRVLLTHSCAAHWRWRRCWPGSDLVTKSSCRRSPASIRRTRWCCAGPGRFSWISGPTRSISTSAWWRPRSPSRRVARRSDGSAGRVGACARAPLRVAPRFAGRRLVWADGRVDAGDADGGRAADPAAAERAAHRVRPNRRRRGDRACLRTGGSRGLTAYVQRGEATTTLNVTPTALGSSVILN